MSKELELNVRMVLDDNFVDNVKDNMTENSWEILNVTNMNTFVFPDKVDEDEYYPKNCDIALVFRTIGQVNGYDKVPSFLKAKDYYSSSNKTGISKSPCGFLTSRNSIMPMIIIPTKNYTHNGLVFSGENHSTSHSVSFAKWGTCFNWIIAKNNDTNGKYNTFDKYDEYGKITETQEDFSFINTSLSLTDKERMAGKITTRRYVLNDKTISGSLYYKLPSDIKDVAGESLIFGSSGGAFAFVYAFNGTQSNGETDDNDNEKDSSKIKLSISASPSKESNTRPDDKEPKEFSITIPQSGNINVDILGEKTKGSVSPSKNSQKMGQMLEKTFKDATMVICYPVWNGFALSGGIDDRSQLKDSQGTINVTVDNGFVAVVDNDAIMTDFMEPHFSVYNTSNPKEIVVENKMSKYADTEEKNKNKDLTILWEPTLHLDAINCLPNFAYTPVFFQKTLSFSVYIKESFGRDLLDGDDLREGTKRTHYLYPIYCENGTTYTSADKGVKGEKMSIKNKSKNKDEKDDGEDETEYYRFDFSFSAPNFQRRGIEIFGFYHRVLGQNKKREMLNTNGRINLPFSKNTSEENIPKNNYGFINKFNERFTGENGCYTPLLTSMKEIKISCDEIVKEKFYYNLNWLDYATEININRSATQTGGQISLDKYAMLGQFEHPFQPVGEIRLKAVGGVVDTSKDAISQNDDDKKSQRQDASSLIQQGEDLVSQGQSLVEAGKEEEGNAKIEEGNSLIQKGNDLIQEGNNLITQGEEKTQEGSAKIEEGNAKIEEGNNLIDGSDGNAKIEEGNTLIQEGNGKIREGNSYFPGNSLIEKGQSLEEQGTALIKKENLLIQEGNDLIIQGEDLIQNGNELIEEGNEEEGNSLIAQGEDLIQNGNELIEEGNENVEKGVELLKAGNAKIEKGNTLITQGNYLIQEGESATNDGEELIKQGNALIEEGNSLIAQGEEELQKAYELLGDSDNVQRGNDLIQKGNDLIIQGEDLNDDVSESDKEYGNALIQEGNALIQEGNALIQEGNTLIESSGGNAKIEEGNALIQEGNTLIQEGNTLIQEGNALTNGEDNLLSPLSEGVVQNNVSTFSLRKSSSNLLNVYANNEDVYFTGLGIGISYQDSEGADIMTLNVSGIEQKLQDIKLAGSPFFDGDPADSVMDYLSQYGNFKYEFSTVFNTYNWDSSSKKYKVSKKRLTTNPAWMRGGDAPCPRSVEFQRPSINFLLGTSVWEAIGQVCEKTSKTYFINKEGIVQIVDNNVYGIPMNVAYSLYYNKPSFIIDSTQILNINLQPYTENVYNQVVTASLKGKRKGGEFPSLQLNEKDMMPNVRYSKLISGNFEYPWSRMIVNNELAILSKKEAKKVHQVNCAQYSSATFTGGITIPGNSLLELFDTIQIGNVNEKDKKIFYITGISHNYSSSTRVWTTSLQVTYLDISKLIQIGGKANFLSTTVFPNDPNPRD